MTSLVNRDLRHIWHPCAQMKDYEVFPPLEIHKAYGSYIELKNGNKIIDAISSWWCKSFGHNHPRLKAALIEQADQFEHVILAHTTHETVVHLAEKLATLSPSLTKILFGGDGSSVVEMALKMSLHARKILGESDRTLFVALENSYHGETTGALSVSDVGIYRAAYEDLLFPTYFIKPLPYRTGMADPRWNETEDEWSVIEKKLSQHAHRITAIIVEPLLQGGGFMKLYSPDFLRKLRVFCDTHRIHLIADEIMTGLGRTGKMLACHHAGIEPDFLCLGKGLTAGWMPFSALLTSPAIYELFYGDYREGNSFLHSHTYSGNALAARIALEVFALLDEEKGCEQATQLGHKMHLAMTAIAEKTGKLTNLRHLGAMVAADLISQDRNERMGFKFYQQAIAKGAYIRPLGDTIYWLPPLNMGDDTLEKLQKITEEVLVAL